MADPTQATSLTIERAKFVWGIGTIVIIGTLWFARLEYTNNARDLEIDKQRDMDRKVEAEIAALVKDHDAHVATANLRLLEMSKDLVRLKEESESRLPYIKRVDELWFMRLPKREKDGD